MRSHTVLGAAAAVLLVVALAFGLTRAGGSRAPAPPATVPRAAPAAPATSANARVDSDPRRLRDIFRFEDEERAAARERAGARAALLPLAPAVVATPVPGPRLVGILRRSGRLVAALSLDGEVELAADGQTAAGVTVLSVADDSVRIRRADGSEETLNLPE